jgi:hypothetical protein
MVVRFVLYARRLCRTVCVVKCTSCAFEHWRVAVASSLRALSDLGLSRTTDTLTKALQSRVVLQLVRFVPLKKQKMCMVACDQTCQAPWSCFCGYTTNYGSRLVAELCLRFGQACSWHTHGAAAAFMLLSYRQQHVRACICTYTCFCCCFAALHRLAILAIWAVCVCFQHQEQYLYENRRLLPKLRAVCRLCSVD